MTFRSDIQGLRGLAILLVVCYHAHLTGVSGGFVGVDVFFVLSGYLITGLLFKEFGKTGEIKLGEFYARRARRLLPASAVVLVATVVTAQLILSPLEQANLASSGIATALYVSNLFFIRHSTDYLASPPEGNPFLHTWSLSVEEQFYLAWPATILLLVKMFRSRSIYLGAMALLAVASFALNVWLTTFAQPWAFFGPASRVWEFAAGGLIAVTPIALARQRPLVLEMSSGVGLAMIIASAVFFDETTTFPSVAALLPVTGTVLLLACGEKSNTVAAFLRTRVMVWLGDLSYVWYLWHWPTIVLAAALIPGLGVRGRVVCGVVSLLLSAVSRKLLEDKVRFSPWLVARPLTTLAIAAVVTVVTTTTGALWRDSALRASVSATQTRFSMARDDNPIVYSNGCHLNYDEVTSPECVFGEALSSTTVVLFGDSHAAQWFPAFEQLAKAEKIRLVSLTKSGCPSVDVAIRDLRIGRRYTECETWRHNSLARILAEKPSLVVLANASDYVEPATMDVMDGRVSPWAGDLPIARTSLDWYAGLRRTLDALSKHGLHSAILRDTPRPGFDAPTCLARRAWRSSFYGECRFVREATSRPDIARAEDIATGASPLTSIVDVSSIICDEETCDTERGGLVMYRDHHHLTATFSASLTPELAASIKSVMAYRSRQLADALVGP